MHSLPGLALQRETPGTRSSLQCRWDEGETCRGEKTWRLEKRGPVGTKEGTTQIASMVRETRGFPCDPDLQR